MHSMDSFNTFVRFSLASLPPHVLKAVRSESYTVTKVHVQLLSTGIPHTHTHIGTHICKRRVHTQTLERGADASAYWAMHIYWPKNGRNGKMGASDVITKPQPLCACIPYRHGCHPYNRKHDISSIFSTWRSFAWYLKSYLARV